MIKGINVKNEFIQKNSSEDSFLQSEWWRKFQENFGRKTFYIKKENSSASIIEHKLPMVGKYFYIPHGPIMPISCKVQNLFSDLFELAKKNNINWIRIEPADENMLKNIKNSIKYETVKSFRNMQPEEVLVIDITKTENQLLSEMRSKTRYNIRLSEKKGVFLRIAENCKDFNNKDVREFLKILKITAKRNKIIIHSDEYYQEMLKTIPENILKLYVAEYNGKIIAANLVVFYGGMATYLHGASDNKHRNVMAPYFLQWRQIQDAKKIGCSKYNFGGVFLNHKLNAKGLIRHKWNGITKFKVGFSPNTAALVFSGSYDIILNPIIYWAYRTLQKGKSFLL